MRSRGSRIRRGSLTAIHLADGPEGQTRIAFAVNKRIGGAVVRNRLRRRIRAILDDLDRSQPALLPGGALLLAPTADAVQCSPDELRNDVMRVLEAIASRRTGR